MTEVISDIDGIMAYCERCRAEGRTIALVPTMGALHEGHLSLIDLAAKSADVVVVSVYVNPTQFAPTEDFDNYPRDLDADVKKMTARGAHVVFAPNDKIMYPAGYATYVTVEGLTNGLCGRSRPAHFRGVTTIVTKLFNIVRPNIAVFGQKDAQQAAVIRRMTTDLNIGTEIIIAPIMREADGLAMSSRNAYLSAEERAEAPVLFRSLQAAKRMAAAGITDAETYSETIHAVLGESPMAEIEYVEIVDHLTMKPVERVENETLIALAVRFGDTRLIDNIVINPGSL